MKSVATGLTCVALVAVLATWSLGDGQAPEPPRDVEIEATFQELPLVIESNFAFVEGEPLAELQQSEVDIAALQDGTESIVTVIGEELEGPAEGASEQTQAFAFVLNGVQDKEAQASLDKVADQLAGQADALEKEGKTAEAQAKRAAAQAIRGFLEKGPVKELLKGQGAGGNMRFEIRLDDGQQPRGKVVRKVVKAQIAGQGPAGKEFVELQQHLEALRKKLNHAEGNLTGDSLEEARRSLMAEMEAVESKLAAQKNVWTAEITPEELPTRFRVQQGRPAPRVMLLQTPVRGAHQQALAAQADALLKASQALKLAGRHEEAKKLMAESEELRTHASHLEDHMIPVDPRHPGAFVPKAQLQEVHASLKELHEQIQSLRKEVAELKDLLKK